jgi:hypothetical protein
MCSTRRRSAERGSEAARETGVRVPADGGITPKRPRKRGNDGFDKPPKQSGGPALLACQNVYPVDSVHTKSKYNQDTSGSPFVFHVTTFKENSQTTLIFWFIQHITKNTGRTLHSQKTH